VQLSSKEDKEKLISRLGTHAHGPTSPHSCAISFHLPGKMLPGGFNLILSGYIFDAWGKNMGFKASDLCFVNTAL
jgi:hypothetical protein